MNDEYCQKRKTPSEYEKIKYIDEVNSLCPLCGKSLLVDISGTFRKNFQIAHIYPCNPTSKQRIELNQVERLGTNSEDTKNKIALCTECHQSYDNNTTVQKYNALIEIKKKCMLKQNIEFSLSKETMEQEIEDVIIALSHIDINNMKDTVKLSYDALHIKEKISDDNIILRNRIENDVAQYYYIIQSYFKNIESSDSFDLIALKIKCAFIKIKKETYDKELIYSKLIEWLISKTQNTNYLAAGIVVSYFVQNCEIYDKITE